MPYYSTKIKEGELKNRVREEWFSGYNATREIGNIDFSVYEKADYTLLSQPEPYLWAESKPGDKHNPVESIVQLILTIGKEHTHEKMLQPSLLAAFDAKRICFIEYSSIMHIFSQPWVKWNVTPSDYSTESFQRVLAFLKDTIQRNFIIFEWDKDAVELRQFIRSNFKKGKSKTSRIQVNRTNFTYVYYRWCDEVKDTILIDWEAMKKNGVFDHDFFLADLMSENGVTIRENLAVVLQESRYRVKKDIGGMGFFKEVEFKDNQHAYNQFWNSYERPPKVEYRKYILDRADLLVPQNIREIEGSYYTPKIWVEKSQQYLADTYGELWQEEYYVWDCAAGSGNLMRGLTNRYRVWASTLNQSDVDIMRDSAINNEFNMLPEHIFQFDFLNDSFDDAKVPSSLKEVLSNPQKRKNLIIYINPPYKEHTDAKQAMGTGQNISSLSNTNVTYSRYLSQAGTALRELYAQFLLRIYFELPDTRIACFSTLKHLQASNFRKFRNLFKMELRKAFLVPGFTFDNVEGSFPICFQIWDRADRLYFDNLLVTAFNPQGNPIAETHLTNYDKHNLIIDWIRRYYDKNGDRVGFLIMMGTDVYHNRYINISNRLSENESVKHLYTIITKNNVVEMCVYCAVRNAIDNTWLNNREQYVEPSHNWENDRVFQTDCLIYSAFINNVRGEEGINNWIPFKESDVNSPDTFTSNFFYNLLNGTVEKEPLVTDTQSLFGELDAIEAGEWKPFDYFSEEAKAVYESGKELWRYYMQQKGINVNASLYDIKLYFQGVKKESKKQTLNVNSDDEHYNTLRQQLNRSIDKLRSRIQDRVYEYQFLVK